MSTALKKFTSETTAHGILHLTGERRVYVKVVWLVAVLLSLSYCTFKVYGAIHRFASGEFATTIKASDLDFEFPDVYFCNERSISGSYSVTLSDKDNELLNRYRKMVSDSLITSKVTDIEEFSRIKTLSLASTLPYQFLADKMGHRMEQSILATYLGDDALRTVVFYHPLLVNCFQLNISNEEIRQLQQPNTPLLILLFLDPALPPPFDNSTQTDLQLVNKVEVDVKPYNWDLNYGLDFYRPSGFRIFITPRGQYPSETEAMLVVGTGDKHSVKIRMQDIVYKQEDFYGKCQSNSEATVGIVNPYSLQKLSFVYSQGFCWYREIFRLSHERYNCSVWKIPTPWEYRSVPNCYNLTEFNNSIITALNNSIRQSIHQDAMKYCMDKIPCRQRSYTIQYSSGNWPTEQDWIKFFRGDLLNNKLNASSSSFMPGISYLVHNSSFEKVRESLLQIEISAAELQYQQIEVSLAYKFDSLIADIGGLLGLFLGMSLMSVLELVELMHDCVLTVWETKKRRKSIATDLN